MEKNIEIVKNMSKEELLMLISDYLKTILTLITELKKLTEKEKI